MVKPWRGEKRRREPIFPHLRVDGLGPTCFVVSYGQNILSIGKFLGIRAAKLNLSASQCSGISSSADC